MTDLDRGSLDRILPFTPGAPDWSDVLRRAREGQVRRRRRFVACAAVTLIAVVGTASAFGTVRDFVLSRGFIGLPPLGATPSTPESAELIVSAWSVHAGARTRLWAYGDGRLIWQREFIHRRADLPESANGRSSGFLEQRLTPEGVELLRSRIISTGLFAEDLELSFHGSQPAACANFIRVRDGDRLVRVTWFGFRCPRAKGAQTATPGQASALQRLVARLADLTAWLPAGAWKDRKIRAYVPSRYAIQYGAQPQSLEASRILALLPAPARELLRAKDRTRTRGFYGFAGGPMRVVYGYSSAVTTKEARALAATLDDAGIKRGQEGAYALSYSGKAPGPRGNTFSITFEPILPHGGSTCSACG
jgi:hypothetical protein